MAKIEFYGKQIVYNQHLTLPIDNLLINNNKSFNTNNKSIKDNNIIIKGDNLKALKALLPYYQGKIDVIYIDPPYNTGTQDNESGWVYNDNMDNPAFKKWLDNSFIKKDDMSKHDKWLCFMWVRLQLAKELLSDNGVMFISLDDNENLELGLILKEIFGNESLEHIIWKKTDPKYDKNTNAKVIKRSKRIHEYIHIAFKNKNESNFGKIMKKPNWLNKRPNVDNDPRGGWESGIISFQEGHKKEDKKSPYYYTITKPNGNKMTRHFFVLEDEFQRLREDNRIYFPKDGDGVPRLKIFEDEEKEFALETILEGMGSLNKGKQELVDIFGEDYLIDLFGDKKNFSTPKPTKLIKEIIRAATNNKSSIILDFFAGSGTTAQAILDLNEEDCGNRNYILIEQEEYIDTLVTERIKKTHPNSSFNYFDLEPRIKKERLFKKDTLPTLEELQKQLNINVFSNLDEVEEELKIISKKHNLFQLGKRNNESLLIMYKDDWDWLRSNNSSITEDIIEILKKMKDLDKIYIYSTSRFVSHEELVDNNINFLRLPLDI